MGMFGNKGLKQSMDEEQARYNPGGDLYRSGLGEGGGKGKTTVAGVDVKTTPEKKGNTQFTITGKSGKVYNYDSFSDFSKEYQQNDDFNAELAINAINAYSGGNKENSENLFNQLYGGKLTDFAKSALDKYKNADLYEAQKKSEAASTTRQKEAEKAADELLEKGREAAGKSGLQNEKDKERYSRVMKAADELFKGNVDDAYVENLPHFIWDEYGYLKKAYENKGYTEKDAKKQAAKQTGYFLIQNLGTALSNMSHTIKGDGAQEKSDYEKVQESRLQGAMERYNKKLDESMQKDIDAVKSILGNEVNVENSLKQIYANAAIRNAYAKLDQKYKAYVANEMIKRGGSMSNADLMALIKTGFIDQGIDGKLADEALGLGKDITGGLMELATKK